jgi:hypothetical protein
VLKSKWFVIALTVALAVITIGSAAFGWTLAKTVFTSLGPSGFGGEILIATGQSATTLGWVASGIQAALAVGSISFSARAILGNVIGFAAGIGSSQALSSLGGAVGVGGTPDWNPAGNNFQKGWRPPVRRGGGFRTWRSGLGRPRRQRPAFRELKDHAKRHSELTPGEYYYEAFLHTKYSQWKFKFYHDGHTKFAYVTRIGPDHYMFTSGSLNGRQIFTHYPIKYRTLQNLGITLLEARRRGLSFHIRSDGRILEIRTLAC